MLARALSPAVSPLLLCLSSALATGHTGFLYTGLDASELMIQWLSQRFNQSGLELPAGTRYETVDLNSQARPWPVPDHSVRLFFGARSLHWLQPLHALDEVGTTMRKRSPAWTHADRVRRSGAPHAWTRAVPGWWPGVPTASTARTLR